MLIATAVIAVMIGFVVVTADFWINWWWFGSVGYRSVLVTRYVDRAVIAALFGVVTGAFFFGNAVFAFRRTRRSPVAGSQSRPAIAERVMLPVVLGASLLVLLIAAGTGWSNWERVLLWSQGESFGHDDPVFGRDVGFFVFALPVFHLVRSLLTWVVFATLIAVALIYGVRLGVNPRRWRETPRLMRTHVLALLGVLVLLIGASFWLASYELAFSDRGFVFGAGYTDATIQRWANVLMALLSVGIAALLVLNAFINRLRLLLGALAAWAVLAIVLTGLLPPAIQGALVQPSEFRRERPYIENNIAETRLAYGVDGVEGRSLSGQAAPTTEELAAQPVTIDNIRLWDYRVILETYQQQQSFAPYYVFLDVDVDRYIVDGTLTQVLLSARELEVDGLPENAQTWTNLHLTYTHGYGLVASPVGEVSRSSLPVYLVGSIPPSGTGALSIERPQIYFGEGNPQWVILNTSEEEFDGLIGEASVTPQPYAGEARGSIDVGGTIGQIFASVYFRDRNIWLSGAVTGDSRLVFRRNIVERAEAIAPFLQYEPDPYLVIADGRLYWVIDAYTTTDRFPHATRHDGLNYIRNTVKVIVDAYDGTITFYRTDVPDPIADAYAGLYDDLFTPIAEAPPSITDHFRYPEHLFDLQTEVFSAYHVTDPRLFYDGEERWAIAQEQVEGQVQQMVPYYVMMTLPEEQAPGLTLIRPFTPGGQQSRQNMTAWMAARLDGPDGGPRLVAYEFPRQAIVLGPRQVEARIDQNPEISSQITLWNQSGSEVIRGNLLVVPIGQGLLYVQPLYLRATNTEAAFPELRRVIVATSEQVVMGSTLGEALAGAVLPPETAGEPPPSDQTAVDGGTGGGEEAPAGDEDLAQQALAAFERGEEARIAGDWAAYGEAQADLEAVLREMAGEATPATMPEATPTG
jgi:uncharacterized membrane protein (UPF0182 family)